jgi:lysophospholipase L1-like esterase
MPDYWHLSAKGYDLWGKAIKGDLEKLLKEAEQPEAERPAG